jgi:hypothetical protein
MKKKIKTRQRKRGKNKNLSLKGPEKRRQARRGEEKGKNEDQQFMLQFMDFVKYFYLFIEQSKRNVETPRGDKKDILLNSEK